MAKRFSKNIFPGKQRLKALRTLSQWHTEPDVCKNGVHGETSTKLLCANAVCFMCKHSAKLWHMTNTWKTTTSFLQDLRGHWWSFLIMLRCFSDQGGTAHLKPLKTAFGGENTTTSGFFSTDDIIASNGGPDPSGRTSWSASPKPFKPGKPSFI